MRDQNNVVEWTKGQTSKKNMDRFVSIYSQGRIGIPKNVFTELLDSPEAVKLKFDKDRREIGITPADSDDPNSYIVDPDTRYITASAFLTTFELDVEESVRHPISDSNGTVWVDTNKTH